MYYMWKFLAFVAITGVSWTGHAQDPAKYAATITKEDLNRQLSIVAGAEMEGRETATEGQRKAAAYIAGEFSRIGLKPAPRTTNYQQEYPLFYDTITKVELVINGKPLQF